MRDVVLAWGPLAASWLLMSAELPAISAVIARLDQPEVNLAAYGSVVFPLAVVIESPVIMLLAASTALCRDWESYRRVYRYMHIMAAALTGVHLVVALTPLFDLIVGDWMGIPVEVRDPARLGLLIMTPWTWSIAYRRFHQGVLIRFGLSRKVGLGTAVRLSADLLVLGLGFLWLEGPGVVVAACAVSVGVVAEAAFIGFAVQTVLRGPLKIAPARGEPVTAGSFLRFYVPLATTSLLVLLVQPLNSAAMSRMPKALESLAVWPVTFGLLFVLRCLGHAYQEVVVALADRPGALEKLRDFALGLALFNSGLLLLFAGSSLGAIWFRDVAGLQPDLAQMGYSALWIAVALPGLSAIHNWLQGILVDRRRTRNITESVLVFLLVTASGLLVATTMLQIPGLRVGLLAFTIGAFAQSGWLYLCVRRSGGVLARPREGLPSG